MRTLRYKTLAGLIRSTGQLTVEQALDGRYHNSRTGWRNFSLSDEARSQMVSLVSEQFPPSKRDKAARMMMYGRGDHSEMRFFYLEITSDGRIRVSTSLGGYIRELSLRRFLNHNN